ncbi:MAG TPA: DUF6580 family putative transport protein [Cyclobacteriaceae bacterium]|jgi:hypothetical protein|nr:DUF6580 family putative transport protein [Cyclobacteriaceae bacterium]
MDQMVSKINPRPVLLAGMILLAGCYRLFIASGVLPPLPNFTPLGAMALFGGCYYQDKWKAYLVPLLSLWLTDILLNRFFYFGEWVFFYDGFAWVYISFALMVLIGGLLIKKVLASSVLLAGVAGALVHWIVSDFGVWLGGGIDITTGLPFTRDFMGYLKCLYLALPFMKNLLLGNLVFGAVLFGSFELMQRRYPKLQLQSAYRNS